MTDIIDVELTEESAPNHRHDVYDREDGLLHCKYLPGRGWLARLD